MKIQRNKKTKLERKEDKNNTRRLFWEQGVAHIVSQKREHQEQDMLSQQREMLRKQALHSMRKSALRMWLLKAGPTASAASTDGPTASVASRSNKVRQQQRRPPGQRLGWSPAVG